MPVKEKTIEIVVSPIQADLLEVRIENIPGSSLIVHAWSEKAKRMMLEKQQKKKVTKEIRDPEKEFEESLYNYPTGGYGFPVNAIKNAMTACAHKDIGVEKTLVRKALFVNVPPHAQELVKIIGEPVMREDMVRIGMGTADLRYRAEFLDWAMDLTIEYDKTLISADSVINLLNNAGYRVGIGEWRPETDGPHGRFKVTTA